MRFTLPLALIAACGYAPAAEPPPVAMSEHKSPSDERASFRVPAGFEVQLVAAEPDIQKPINMAFDAKGRLWVTCTIEYPYAAPDGKGRDSVKILEDFGPDGRARKVSTFADGLNIPIGILPYQDGAIVYSIPNIWRLRDTKGTGKCDTREVLLSGFGHRDTHGMVNGLVLGFDGWVYACHGYLNDSVVKGKDGSEIRMQSGNVFRFKPDGSRVEMVCRGQVNPFGQCLDPLGNLYTACCHSKPITQLLRGAVYTSFGKPHDGLGFGPDMIHEYRGSTALCGLAWYEADHYPAEYRGRMFLGDVVFSCINIFDIERTGATYTAKQQKADFLSSSDPWFRPCDIKLGPDGALYVADFYNRIIGHYEVALNHPGRDRTSGRIWRIVYKGADGKAQAPTMTVLNERTPEADLLRNLSHPNLTVRLAAATALVAELDLTRRLEQPDGNPAMLRRILLEIIGPNQPPIHRAHGLWIVERESRLDDATLKSGLVDSDSTVRVHTVRILAERQTLTTEQEQAIIAALSDADALVRRVASDALARHPSQPALTALLALRAKSDTLSDPFLLHTVRMALREQLRGGPEWVHGTSDADNVALADAALGVPEVAAGNFLIKNISLLHEKAPNRLPEFVRHAAHHAGGDYLRILTAYLQNEGGKYRPTKGVELLAFVRGFQEGGTELPGKARTWATDRVEQLLLSSDARELQHGLEAVLILRPPQLAGNVATVALDSQRRDHIRIAALAALMQLDPRGQVTTLTLRLSDASESFELRAAVAKALAEANRPDARTALVNALPTAPARLASAIAIGLAGTPAGAGQLCDAVAVGKASPRLLTEPAVMVKIEALRNTAIKARTAKLTEGLPPADANLAKLLRQRHDGYRKATTDVAAGAKLYTQHCGNCHQIAGQGAKIGPQLDGIGVRGLDRLLEDVLDPNRNVDQAFRTTALTLKSGRQLSGLLLREEGEVLVLADAQGKEVRVEKGEVELRETQPLSPMPANWGEQIPEKEFYDLMAYLLAQRAK